MTSIYLRVDYQNIMSVKEMKKEFEVAVDLRKNEVNFVNTEAALFSIVRGAIDYFNSLDSDFLGAGNYLGIPSEKTDHFVNNFYRLSNALKYLEKIFKIEIETSEEWGFLNDVRTLIVHSGEQVSNLASMKLEKYKDTQLGRIFKNGEDVSSKIGDKKKYDYRLQIWADKHDKSKNRLENQVDYDRIVENFRDVDIYLNSRDVKNIVMFRIEQFINEMKSINSGIKQIKKLPDVIKKQVISSVNFDKIESLIKNKSRGGYFIENERQVWLGFGLKRLWQYVSEEKNISSEVCEEIEKVIQQRLEEFWESYNDETIGDDDLPTLDAMDVFKKYTPYYKEKHYFESEKLYDYIVPTFNEKKLQNESDVDYLLKFIKVANEALGSQLNLENTANGVICDYFVKAVEKTLNERSFMQ